jgi:hypothetical protein
MGSHAPEREWPMAFVKFGRRKLRLPRSRLVRRVLGFGLIAGGVLGFLPILGFWMVPLGLVVLSVDSHGVRRFRRGAAVRLGRWLKPRFKWLATMLGYRAG